MRRTKDDHVWTRQTRMKQNRVADYRQSGMIVFGGKIQAGPVAGETRNDAAMFLAEPGRFKGLTKVLPSHGCVGGEARALQRRQRVNGGREGTNGLLDALIGRRQLELGVEHFEVMTELLSKRQGVIGCGSSRFRHGDGKDDTRSKRCDNRVPMFIFKEVLMKRI